MIEHNQVKSTSKVQTFIVKLKQCLAILRSSKYVIVDVEHQGKESIHLMSMNMEPEETLFLFSDYVLKSYQNKNANLKIDELMKEVNARPLFD